METEGGLRQGARRSDTFTVRVTLHFSLHLILGCRGKTVRFVWRWRWNYPTTTAHVLYGLKQGGGTTGLHLDYTIKQSSPGSIMYEKLEVVCLSDGAQYLSFEYISVLKLRVLAQRSVLQLSLHSRSLKVGFTCDLTQAALSDVTGG